ncbi:hypothetical protein R1flu_012234 [Riccia fluitans]|uniref:Uncharacterized protein n=1 Tax=Riccia fluitans TaxID=41844 RepID=A0ABD1ZDC7_9MARC
MSSGSSSSLDTSSDADSGGPEQSDDQLQEAKVAEVQSLASVVESRAKAILIAERKLAEAAEDIGEFEERADRDGDSSRDEQQSANGAESSTNEGSSESEGDAEIHEALRTNGAVPS